jgi:hypothetical protein
VRRDAGLPTLCVAWVATQRASGCAAQSVSAHLQQRERGARPLSWRLTRWLPRPRGVTGGALQVCCDVGARATSVQAVAALEFKTRGRRHDRHALSNTVHLAADGRGDVGAVPLAPSAVGGEDTVDRLARGALGASVRLREKGRLRGRCWAGVRVEKGCGERVR